jgi:pantetheine-phosphate adenylyltransferase
MQQGQLTSNFTSAVYAGSFSPITKGHHDIILQAARAFDQLYIAVGVNPSKKPIFTPEERIEMIEHDIQSTLQPALQKAGIECDLVATSYTGMTARFMEASNAPFYVRGLRLGTEFDTEYPDIMHSKKVFPGFTPVFFCSTNSQTQIVSSSAARGLCHLREDDVLTDYVTPFVKNKLITRMEERGLRM